MDPHPSTPLRPEPLPEVLARAEGAEWALIGLGKPRCPACMLLPPSFAALSRARPGLMVALVHFAEPRDWAARESLLWPRGIHVSPASLPVLVLMHRGEVVASRPGGAPAHQLDSWLAQHMGAASHPVPPGHLMEEVDALERMAPRRAQHSVVRGRGPLDGAGPTT